MATTSSTKITNDNNRDQNTAGVTTGASATTGAGGAQADTTQGMGNTLRGAVGEILGEGRVDQIIDRAQPILDRAQPVLDRAADVAGQVQDVASDYLGDATAFLRRNPLQAVLIGFGVGCLVGALLVPKR